MVNPIYIPSIGPTLAMHCYLGSLSSQLVIDAKKILHQRALTGWDDRCLNYCVFFAVFVTKLKNKRREGGIFLSQSVDQNLSKDNSSNYWWNYSCQYLTLWFSSDGAVVMWCRMFAMTLNAVLCHSSIMINPKYDFVFLCCFWAKRGVILAKIKNDFPRVKSNHI